MDFGPLLNVKRIFDQYEVTKNWKIIFYTLTVAYMLDFFSEIKPNLRVFGVEQESPKANLEQKCPLPEALSSS